MHLQHVGRDGVAACETQHQFVNRVVVNEHIVRLDRGRLTHAILGLLDGLVETHLVLLDDAVHVDLVGHGVADRAARAEAANRNNTWLARGCKAWIRGCCGLNCC